MPAKLTQLRGNMRRYFSAPCKGQGLVVLHVIAGSMGKASILVQMQSPHTVRKYTPSGRPCTIVKPLIKIMICIRGVSSQVARGLPGPLGST